MVSQYGRSNPSELRLSEARHLRSIVGVVTFTLASDRYFRNKTKVDKSSGSLNGILLLASIEIENSLRSHQAEMLMFLIRLPALAMVWNQTHNSCVCQARNTAKVTKDDFTEAWPEVDDGEGKPGKFSVSGSSGPDRSVLEDRKIGAQAEA
ncbi:hypothetical protein FOIG_02816 [Fusarium odoratissimum NRRL 54006]|uniref:Uncharacterized protein n=1 Tax=Fusarium odoratissimum (strain NRRL 54006) TaxID=1089451 RepID=X0KGQ2_FUSO5|nr:uncharacterized protein FOIG_02816 [Fusarium odoratissimum NRRL 54006]EXM07907.1 hypothetical protein FOIG_02816 [Fusarium odoratissimum NRRL 54006]